MEQNKAKERFTRTWAIEQHRKMWHWIADQIKEGNIVDAKNLWEYKRAYARKRYQKNYIKLSTDAYCFCCLFASRELIRIKKETYNLYRRCVYCPLKLNGCQYYNELLSLGVLDTEEKKQCAIRLCEYIAEAPERKA